MALFSNAVESPDYGPKANILRNRIAGEASKSTRNLTNQRLDDAQESALLRYIKRLDDINQPPTPELVVGAANFILSRDDALADPIGKNWFQSFMQRHPELVTTTQRPLDIDRKDANCIEVLEEYFGKLRVKMMEYGIVPQDAWNMDETGFRIGCARSRVAVTFDRSKKKKNIMADPNNRDYGTAVESINAVGETIPHLLILKAAHVLFKWGMENDLDDDIAFGRSASGYSNDALALDWLGHFIKHTAMKRVGKYQLLIIDGFGSHMTHEFINLADANDIKLFKLPAHSTHLTQPLDVGVFQPYKAAHGKAIDAAVRNGDGKFSRLEFLAAFQGFRTKTFVRGTIKNAWRRTGIFPFNPEAVLAPLRTRRAEEVAAQAQEATRPNTPPPTEFESLNHTPRGPGTMKRAFKFLDQVQKENGGSYIIPPTHMRRFLKAAKRMSLTLDIRTRDLNNALEETAKRKERADLRGFRAATCGIVERKDCRAMYSGRLQKAAAGDKRKALKALQKKEDEHKSQVEQMKATAEHNARLEQAELDAELQAEHEAELDAEERGGPPAPEFVLAPEVQAFNAQLAQFTRPAYY